MPFNKSKIFNDNKNVQKILTFITEKGYSLNERLPSERELVSLLGLGRNSIREALKVLEALGVVEIRHGSGVYLRKTDLAPKGDSAVWLLIHKNEIFNMIAVREALDLKAIETIPESDYIKIRDQLKDCIAAVKRTNLSNEEMLKHDLEFHNIIRRASGNDILLNICVSLTGSIYDERKVLYDQEKYVERSLWEHTQIANAFGSCDINEIKQAYIAHLASTRTYIENTQV